jgi:uncharacterized protein YbaA (DUF1428 family)
MKEAYIDGFLLVVPRGKEAEYKKMATLGKEVWLKHGALDYKECVGDDLQPEGMSGMKPRSFIEAAGATVNETVWLSFIVFKSREHRDEVNKKVMADPLMNNPDWKDKPMPFDFARFCYGGFKVEVGE